MKQLLPLTLLLTLGGCASTGSMNNCGPKPERPEFSCSSHSESKDVAYGYCAQRTVGCTLASMALGVFNPASVATISGDICEASADAALGLKYEIDDLVADISFKTSSWYLAASGHPVLATIVKAGEVGFEFYGCQDEVSKLCIQRYRDWQTALKAHQECTAESQELFNTALPRPLAGNRTT